MARSGVRANLASGNHGASLHLPPQKVVDLLNRYFDCQVPAILRHGGEVLKFIGDGLLAIFPFTEGMADTRETCLRALAAAREADVNIDAIDTFTNTHGVRFGLALHIGEVLLHRTCPLSGVKQTCCNGHVRFCGRYWV